MENCTVDYSEILENLCKRLDELELAIEEQREELRHILETTTENSTKMRRKSMIGMLKRNTSTEQRKK
jgi:ATP-dependent DNA ligase